MHGVQDQHENLCIGDAELLGYQIKRTILPKCSWHHDKGSVL